MAHRIILADTQAIFRSGAARVIAAEEDFEVVAQCADLPQLSEAIDCLHHSIAVFPASMTHDMAGLLDDMEAAHTRSIVIVEHGTAVDCLIAQRIDGAISRSATGAELVACLKRAATGERSVPQPASNEPRPDRVGIRVLKRLTPKEVQIMALVTGGSRNKEVAAQLGTKEQVVKNYLRSIYGKAGVSDRLELAVFAQHHRTLADAAVRVRQELLLTA
ncbi:MAG: response regulator transcription factor [Acidobacteriota bacterium]|nr:response regulator transcription factor [Acidobacteriota bacterium]